MYKFCWFLAESPWTGLPLKWQFWDLLWKGSWLFAICILSLWHRFARTGSALCKSNEMREMTLSLLRFRVKSGNFVYARAREWSKLKGFCKSNVCKGSKCCHFHCIIPRGLVVHARLWQNAVQGPVDAWRAQNAAISWEFVHAGTQSASISRILRFSRFCCMQGSIYCNFPGIFVACRSSTCFTFQDYVCTKSCSKCCSLSRDFVHARVPHVSICCWENCQLIGHQKNTKCYLSLQKLAWNHYEYMPKITLDQLITLTWTS